MKASGDFGRGGSFEEQGERLDEVDSRFFNRRTLARNIQLRAQGHKTFVLTFDNRGQALRPLHDPSLHQFQWTKILTSLADEDAGTISPTANRGWISVRKERTLPSEVLPDTPRGGGPRPPMPPRAPKAPRDLRDSEIKM